MARSAPWAAIVVILAGLVVAACVAVASLARITASREEKGHANALWRIVHDLCVPDARVSGSPAPCLAVDLRRRFAVMKDIRGATQVLVLPTDRVTGIESTSLLVPTAPNYWQDAWEARRYVERRAGRPIARDDIAMAVNSIYGRSQNQLHIHVDCVAPEVRGALAANFDRIGATWSLLPPNLEGHYYRGRRVMGEDLGRADPFKLLAQGDWRARADMGRETLAVLGAQFPEGPGFIVLSDRADRPRDFGVGEDLLDHGCKVLAELPLRAPGR